MDSDFETTHTPQRLCTKFTCAVGFACVCAFGNLYPIAEKCDDLSTEQVRNLLLHVETAHVRAPFQCR